MKLIFKGVVANLFFTAVLMLCAGRPDYMQGWIFLAVSLFSTLLNYFTIRRNTGLIDERAKPGEGIKNWDKIILAVSSLLYLIMVISAGFDSGRLHPPQSVNWWLIAVGCVLILSGQLLFLTARSQNAFFSSVVRIQKERGHAVCDTGLYSIIRHPGYLGMTLSLSGMPLLTTSVWCIIPTVGAIIVLWLRTYLEDQMLLRELDGYPDYSRKTRFMLVPFVW